MDTASDDLMDSLSSSASQSQSDAATRADRENLSVESVEWWEHLRDLLERETGMDLSGTREKRLRDAVSKIASKGLPRLSRLTSDQTTRTQFVERMTAELTVGESFFLRNENHMRVLRESILPLVLKENRSRRDIRLWSAGCAQGEEPYSIAILLDDLLKARDRWQVSILGTDLNSTFLERGQQGSYRRWSFRQTRIHEDPRYFLCQDGQYHIREHLRKCVRFSYLNLVKDVYPSAINGTLGMDLILFRNVAIYLKPEVTTAILARFYRALRPGGWLLLGEIEVTLAPRLGFEVHRFPHATFYRKPLSAELEDGKTCEVELPVLKEVASKPRQIVVPTVPDWVPLHVYGKDSAVPDSDLGTLPQPADEEATAALARDADAKSLQRISELEQALQQSEKQGQSSAKKTSRRTTLRLQLARVFLEVAKVGQAREQLQRCLQEAPLCLEGHLLLAGVLKEQGELQAAEQACRRALYLDRECVIGHFQLGLIQLSMEEVTGGRRSLKNALQLCGKKDPEQLVEYGDGVCYGRFREMVLLLIGEAG